MLQGMTWASPPAFLMPSATSWQASALRLEITTFAPSLASSSAEERPMPRLEPVMTATFPVRSNGVFFIVVGSLTLAPSFRGATKSRARNPSGRGASCEMDSGLIASRCPGMTERACGLHQPARVGDAAEVVVGVAKAVFDHGQPLEVVPDLGFLGHADAAVKLDRLLADELAGLADLHLGGGHRSGAFLGAVEIGRHGREHRHAAGLFERDEHVGGAVLQGLEAADRHAELLAGLEILDGGFQRFIHHADR